jgi:phage terminase large subunit GpA-like protein
MERREDGLKRGHVPARGLMLIAAADVQMRGIWVEVVAFAPNRESWTVDAFYCDGSTEAPGKLLDPPDSPNAFSQTLRGPSGATSRTPSAARASSTRWPSTRAPSGC